ncbi:MAG TPA: hypothetical protein VK306_04670 [Acidimicrobiales bacterium]|nr:hypothetical protein [Acidimicrobiales bacterium]
MNDLLAAEWLKLRTTRLLIGTIPLALVLSAAAVAGEIVTGHGGTGAGGLETSEGIRRLFAVSGSGAIVVLVVGIIISAGEYRHGTAADTFLTTPRRHRVVTAKLAVSALIGLTAGLLIAAVSLGVAVCLYPVKEATFPLGDRDVWLTLAGVPVYTSLFAVLGVGVGSLARNQTLAVGSALAWFAVVEHTLVNLASDIGKWLPAAAGQAIVRTPIYGLLSPLAGVALLTAYAIAISTVGVRTATRRDA